MIKLILPTMKDKKRYISFEIISDKKIFKEEIKDTIYKKALEFFGEDGFAKAGVIVIEENVVRVKAKYKNEMITLLSLIRDINGKRVIINTTKTSGILRKVIKQ